MTTDLDLVGHPLGEQLDRRSRRPGVPDAEALGGFFDGPGRWKAAALMIGHDGHLCRRHRTRHRELERRTAAPRATRRHLPPNRADYTQPNGDRPEHITATARAKRDTVSRWNQIAACELMTRRRASPSPPSPQAAVKAPCPTRGFYFAWD
jgi:hypothetical protein